MHPSQSMKPCVVQTVQCSWASPMNEMKFLLFAACILVTLSVLGLPAGSPSNLLLVANSGENTVSVISLDSMQVLRKITVGQHPQDIVTASDRKRAYVSEVGGEPEFGNTIAEINIASGKIVRRLSL